MLKPIANVENTMKPSWFEFLLDPELLELHFSNKEADPSASDLIIQFLVNSTAAAQPKEIQPTLLQPTDPISENGIVKTSENGTVENKKTLSLKILALKCFAAVDWNLKFLESKLPLLMQQSLMNEFVSMVLSDFDLANSTDHTELDFQRLPAPAVFALSLYYRWCVRIIVKNSIPTRPQKTPIHMLQLPGQNDPLLVASAVLESAMLKIEDTLPQAISVLENLLDTEYSIILPTIHSFGTIKEETTLVSHDWTIGKPIKYSEFVAQTAFDLACLYFHQQNYIAANRKFELVNSHLANFESSVLCKIEIKSFNGFRQACQGIIDNKHPSEDSCSNIHEAAFNLSDNLIKLLEEDNKTRNMSLLQRDQVLATVLSKTNKSHWLYFQVVTCNVIRSMMDGHPIYVDYVNLCKSHDKGGTMCCLDQLDEALEYCNEYQKTFVKNFITSFCLADSYVIKYLQRFSRLNNLFSQTELETLSSSHDNSSSSDQFKLMDDEALPKITGNTRQDFGELHNQLILTYNLSRIQKILQRMHKIRNFQQPLWTINTKWDMPQPLKNFIIGANPGFLQDMAYIVLAKATELRNLKKYGEARKLYCAAETELRDQNFQISQLIQWEVLLTDLMLFSKNDKFIEHRIIKPGVQMCISSVIMDKGSDVTPRAEIIGHCSAFLLNTQEWDYLRSLEITRSGYIEFSKLIAVVCQELKENKGSRVASREFWSIILPIFNSSSQYKRSHTGSVREQQRESPHSILTKMGLNQFLEKIKDQLVLNLVISCLCKLFNLLKDDASYNLHLEYDALWPAVVQNSSALSLTSVQECLDSLLKHSLVIQPTNPGWLRLVADMAYATGYYSQAMKFYLKCGIISSDYFSIPVPKLVWNDQVYNRLVRCCTHLHCYTQAAVFCQFPSEVDYASAFKWLSERPCSDSCDSYYDCIWDITLLEYLINLHAKRGETDRRQLAITAIGQLELNSNNNEEILRNASQIRKTKFLMGLAKQYL